MALLDTYERASWNGIEFPFSSISIKGSLDHYVHKYLHRPGGEVENLARHLYEFKFDCDIHNRYRKYPNIIPDLGRLISLCEAGETHELVLPGFGRFQTKAISWDTRIVATVRSGHPVSFTFIEDSTAEFTAFTLTSTRASNSLPQIATIFKQEADRLGRPDLGNKLVISVNNYITARNAADVTTGLTPVSINSVTGTCRTISSDSVFQSPKSTKASLVLQEAWSTAISIAESNPLSPVTANRYTVPFATSVMKLAMQFYGRSDKAASILAINNFSDALRIPAGSVINFIPV
jgi:hypothetical protein